MADNLSISITADTAQLRAQLAVAESSMRAFRAEMNRAANEARKAGDDLAFGKVAAAASQFEAARAKVAALTSEFGAHSKAIESVSENFRLLPGVVIRARESLAGFKEVLAAAGAAYVVDKLAELTRHFAELGERAVNMAASMGTSVERFSDLSGALTLVGGDATSLSRSTQILARNIETALEQPTGRARDQFEKLGISGVDLAAALKDPTMLLPKLADGFKRLTEAGRSTEALAAFRQTLGRGAPEVIAALKDGAEGLDKLVQKWRATGAGLTTNEAEGLAQIAGKVHELDAAFEGLGKTIVTNLEGPISRSLDNMTKFVEEVNKVARAPAGTPGGIGGPSSGFGMLRQWLFGERAGAPGGVPDRHDTAGSYSADALKQIAREAAAAYGVPAEMFLHQIGGESGWKTDLVSPKGARGIAQFMPGTAAQYGVDVSDPQSSLYGAAHYMSDLHRRTGDWAAAMRGYVGAGSPAAMQNAIAGNQEYKLAYGLAGGAEGGSGAGGVERTFEDKSKAYFAEIDRQLADFQQKTKSGDQDAFNHYIALNRQKIALETQLHSQDAAEQDRARRTIEANAPAANAEAIKARQAETSATREFNAELFTLADQRFSNQKQTDQLSLEAFTAGERIKVALGQETKQQELANEQSFGAKLLADQRARLDQLLAIYAKTPAQLQKVQEQILTLDVERYARQAQNLERQAEANKALMEKWAAPFRSLLDQIGSSFESALTGLLTKQRTWAQTMQQLTQSLTSSAVSSAGSLLSKLGAKTLGATAGEGLGDFLGNQLMKSLNLGDLFSSGGQAASAAASTAAITAAIAADTAATTAAIAASSAAIVGAVETGAVIEAATPKPFGFARGGIVPSAAGGWALPSFAGAQPAILHSKEMVLPAPISEGLQNMIGAGGGGAGDTHLHLHAAVMDAPGIKRWFGDMVARNPGAFRDLIRSNRLSPA